MAISAQDVKKLRELTGAGMLDCKKALEEKNGNIDEAVDYLRQKGLGKAAKKSDRLAGEGLIALKMLDNKKAVLVEINSETDFVAKNENFVNLTKKVASHIFDNNVEFDKINETIIDGQKFEEYLHSQIAVIGENIVVRRGATLEASDNGLVCGYVHFNGRVGAIVHAECDSKETAQKAKDLIQNICMHISAMSPKYLAYTDLDKDWVEKEFLAFKADIEKENEERERMGKNLKNVPEYGSMLQITDDVIKNVENKFRDELLAQGKPEKILPNIIPGMVKRYIKDNTLIDQQYALFSQDFVLDSEKTVEQVIAEKAKEIGGTIEIKKYVRLEVGEGIEKKEEDFAAEVAKQIGQ